MIKGFSFIWGRGVFHCGKYAKGTWFDNNDIHKVSHENLKGFGIKIDLAIGKVIRPIAYFWKLGFWKKDKPTIQDILDKGPEYGKKFFGKELYFEIMALSPHHWVKRTIWNPWYALHWFVLRLPTFIWPYISISTPWINFYIGNRSFKVDPFTRDRTWCGEKEKEMALKEEPTDRFYCLSYSISIRDNRK
jgi:hypothetical protein